MRTDALIAALAADPPAPGASASLRRAVALALAGAAAAVAALFFATIGPRADLAAAGPLAATAAKIALTATLAFAASATALALARPDAPAGGRAWSLLLAPLALALWIGWEFARLGPEGWSARLVGANAAHCLMLIPAFAAIPLAALLAALRRGAPVRPERAGAAAGLAASGLGALFYALNCTDDSPLFILVWYSLATAFVVAVGALAARRLLRW